MRILGVDKMGIHDVELMVGTLDKQETIVFVGYRAYQILY